MTLTATIKVNGSGGTVLRVIPDAGPAHTLRQGQTLEVTVWDGHGLRLVEADEPEPSDIAVERQDGQG